MYTDATHYILLIVSYMQIAFVQVVWYVLKYIPLSFVVSKSVNTYTTCFFKTPYPAEEIEKNKDLFSLIVSRFNIFYENTWLDRERSR